MKKLALSITSLPASIAVGYAVAVYASARSDAIARQQPSMGFGAIGAEFQIIIPTIAALAILCGGLNLLIFRSTKPGGGYATWTRITSLTVLAICILTLASLMLPGLH